MGPEELNQLGIQALYLVLWLSAPALIVAALMGLITGLLSATTQVQDQSLSFVPKLAAVVLTLILTGGFMAREVLSFTRTLWEAIPTLVG